MVIFDEQKNTLRCVFEGNLITTVCAEMEPLIVKRVDELMKKHARIKLIFDLKNAEIVTSAFIRICLVQYKKVGKYDFSIKNASKDIREVFELAGLKGMIRML